MNTNEVSAYTDLIKERMGKKTYLLSKAQAFFEMGLFDTAKPLFLSAATLEERIAALLDTEEREFEAAIHRISAASCYAKADNFSHAVNLYRAALSGPLSDNVRADVLVFLKECLEQLSLHVAHDAPSSLPEEAIIV